MEVGEEAKREPILGANWLKGGLGLLAIAGVWAGGNYLSSRYYEHQSSCSGLVDDLTQMARDQRSPLAPLLIDIVETETMSSTDKSTNCRGLGIYSDGSKTPVTFRHYEEYGKWWLSAEPLAL